MGPPTMSEIRFPFDERKATAAASLLLELAGGTMEYLRLIKLLYIVDRESLETLGRPVSGDQYVSMRHGPVVSRIYDLVKAGRAGIQQPGPWAQHIEAVEPYAVRLKGNPDLGALSEAEVAIISGVFSCHGTKDKWVLRDETHELPEWEDPGDSSRTITVEQILRVLGKTEEEIERVREDAQERAFFASIFGR